jgi:twitching motility protein PilT
MIRRRSGDGFRRCGRVSAIRKPDWEDTLMGQSKNSGRIIGGILKLILDEVAFTDVQVKPGLPMAYRAPRGYRAADAEPVAVSDIEEFAHFADAEWSRRLVAGGGQFDVALTAGDHSRLRCHFFRHGPDNDLGASVRRLPFAVPAIDTLGLPLQLKQFAVQRGKGLILVTGPTGSGKTTTQAALLDHINATKAVHIVTIEQPIEYLLPQRQSIVTQRDVPLNVPSFRTGLEAAKRQRPDVIMIGESRDKDTVDTMLHAADSGHLVIGTMHSRSAEETFDALLAFYSGEEIAHKRNLIASVLICVVSQALLPSRDGSRLVLCSEFLVNGAATAQVIRQGKFGQLENTVATSGARDGSRLLNETLADAVRRRDIAADDALRAAYKPEELQRLIAPYG